MNHRIALGTRGSELALTQSRLVEAALLARWPGIEIETKIIKTSGDEIAGNIAPANAAAGRKGLFTAEIERALLDQNIDVAVHSAKDLPSSIGTDTEIAAVLPRGEVDDVLVSRPGYDLESLPRDGRVATGSVRRRYQLGWNRPDLQIIDLRGNVPTRLRKLIREGWDAAILARAGLERLGLIPNGSPIRFDEHELSVSVLPREVFVPAGGQGIVAMQIRSNDVRTRTLLEAVGDSDTRLCLRAEREFLRLLQGDCNQPVGVFAILDGTAMKVRAQVFRPGETTPREAAVEGSHEDTVRLAAELLKQINAD